MPSHSKTHGDVSWSGRGNQLLSLALFIMLLAFFIVLNTLSSYEDAKVEPVMESIQSAFSAEADKKSDVGPSMVQDDAEEIGEGDTLENLSALFKTRIPGYKADIDRSKGTLSLTLPFDEFSAAVYTIESSENALGEYFLSTLTALVVGDILNSPYRMDVMLNMKENPAALENKKPDLMKQRRKKMATLAEKIEAAGLPRKLMNVGMKKGKPKTVDLLFRPYIPFDPLGEGGVVYE